MQSHRKAGLKSSLLSRVPQQQPSIEVHSANCTPASDGCLYAGLGCISRRPRGAQIGRLMDTLFWAGTAECLLSASGWKRSVGVPEQPADASARRICRPIAAP